MHPTADRVRRASLTTVDQTGVVVCVEDADNEETIKFTNFEIQ